MKKSIKEKFADITQMPKDFVLDMPRVILMGNRDAEISNYKGIIEYTDTVIRLKTNNKQIAVWGEDLLITRLECDELNISGKICGVIFLKKGEKVNNRGEIEQN